MSSKRRLARLITACCVLFLTACGNNPAAQTPTTVAPTSTSQSEWPVRGEWRYSVGWATSDHLASQQYGLWQNAIAVCMKQVGFKYEPVRYVDSDLAYRRANPLDSEVLLKFGYHDPTTRLGPQSTATKPPQAYFDALSNGDGCANRARTYVYDAPAASALAATLNPLTPSADEAVGGYAGSTAGVDAVSSWVKCMASKGFHYDSPDTPRAQFAGEKSITNEELHVRSSDFSCDVASHLTEGRSKYEALRFSSWLDQHAVQLRQVRSESNQAGIEVGQLSTNLVSGGASVIPQVTPPPEAAPASTIARS